MHPIPIRVLDERRQIREHVLLPAAKKHWPQHTLDSLRPVKLAFGNIGLEHVQYRPQFVGVVFQRRASKPPAICCAKLADCARDSRTPVLYSLRFVQSDQIEATFSQG